MGSTVHGAGPGAGGSAPPDAPHRHPRGTRNQRVCPQCAKTFGIELRYCPEDGTALRESPRTDPPEAAAERPDPYAGKVLAGRYLCKRLIGEGGMGVVYEAEHTGIGRKVALKILRSNFVERGDLVARFQREARSASMIGHENIVEVIDSGELEDGGIYIAMELLTGLDVADVIAREAPLGIERALPIVEQTCLALAAAHEKGIVHRDLKPENVFLARRTRADGSTYETVKILDFGIAKFTGADNSEKNRLTQTGSVFGTPEYMAPEQAAGKPVDGRADQYALGVILYEIFTGDVPFHAETFMGVLSKHMFEAPLPPRVFKPDVGIPVALENVILKMMEKEPGARYEDMLEALGAFRAAAAGESAGAASRTGQGPKRASVAGASPRGSIGEDLAVAPRSVATGLLEERPLPRRRGWLTLVIVAVLVAAGIGLVWLGFGGGAGGGAPKAPRKKSSLLAPAAPQWVWQNRSPLDGEHPSAHANT